MPRGSERGPQLRDERCAPFGGQLAAELGLGPVPDGLGGLGVVGVAGDEVPVDVWDEVAEALVVDAGRAAAAAGMWERAPDCAGDPRHIGPDPLLARRVEVGQVLGVLLEDEHAPAAASLVLAEQGVGLVQFGDEGGAVAVADRFDGAAEGAVHAWSPEASLAGRVAGGRSLR